MQVRPLFTVNILTIRTFFCVTPPLERKMSKAFILDSFSALKLSGVTLTTELSLERRRIAAEVLHYIPIRWTMHRGKRAIMVGCTVADVLQKVVKPDTLSFVLV